MPAATRVTNSLTIVSRRRSKLPEFLQFWRPASLDFPVELLNFDVCSDVTVKKSVHVSVFEFGQHPQF